MGWDQLLTEAELAGQQVSPRSAFGGARSAPVTPPPDPMDVLFRSPLSRRTCRTCTPGDVGGVH